MRELSLSLMTAMRPSSNVPLPLPVMVILRPWWLDDDTNEEERGSNQQEFPSQPFTAICNNAPTKRDFTFVCVSTV